MNTSTMEDVFTAIYQRKGWRCGLPESVSGLGSTLKSTRRVRTGLDRVLKQFRIKTLFDAPCGDFNWMSAVPRILNTDYTGADIVAPLIEKLVGRWECVENLTFVHLDITRDEIPEADLWICRDCLQHFSFEAVKRTLYNLMRSRVKFFAATNFPDQGENYDIETGEFRALNLLLKPFELCEPDIEIDDFVKGGPRRTLSFWRRSRLL